MVVESILIEVRPRLKSCNVSIKLHKLHPTRVRVARKSISVDDEPFQLEGLALDPPTMTNLQSSNTFIYFNVQILEFEEKPSSKPSLDAVVPAGELLDIYCTCDELLGRGLSFRRVLPLPSSHWEDADAFCHSHRTKKESKFRDEDCLYGTHFFHISDRVLITDNGHCPKCQCRYAIKHPGYVKIWNTRIVLKIGKARSKRNFLSDFYAIVWDIISGPLAIFSKILLESDKGHFLAMTVLEKSLHVFRFESKSDQHCSTMKPQEKLKIEYVYHGEKNGFVKEWLDNTSVHCIDVDHLFLKEVYSHLESVHVSLHPFYDTIGEKTLSYISCEF